MSNFAATVIPIPGRLSPVDKTTSEIIDAHSNAKYVFLDVYVKFGIPFPLRCLGLVRVLLFMDFAGRRKYGDPDDPGLPEEAAKPGGRVKLFCGSNLSSTATHRFGRLPPL
jgi:hypothetical protein